MRPHPVALILIILIVLVPLPAASLAAGVDPSEPQPDTEAPQPTLDLVFPQDPEVTTFVSSFGAGRSGGRRHAGNDLMAPKMTPVLAAADGVVTRIGDGRLSGRYLVIEHVGGISTAYMHLNDDTPGTDDGAADPRYTFAPGVEEGAFVAAGQHIAYVGDSGNAEGGGPHTHFELRIDGDAIDPYPFLLAAYQRALETLSAERRAELAAQVDDQLRLALSSSSATRFEIVRMELPKATVALSGVPTDGGSESSTQIER